MDEGRDRKRRRSESEDSVGGSIEFPASSRWSPTVEQKGMLESLYGQGIRKPSADQIQRITSMLRAFGHVEGKNVFYWFHNHKAKLRQKQKHEESMANNIARDVMANTSTWPISPMNSNYYHQSCQNGQPNINTAIPWFDPVVRSPCSHALFQSGDDSEDQSNAKLYDCTRGRTKTSKTIRSRRLEYNNNGKIVPAAAEGSGYEEHGRRTADSCHVFNDENITTIGNKCSDNPETLILFPLTPTGILHGRDHKEERFSRGIDGAKGCLSGGQPFFDLSPR